MSGIDPPQRGRGLLDPLEPRRPAPQQRRRAGCGNRPGGPRPAPLTPLGRVVLEHARKLRHGAEQASEAIERFRAGEGRVDIGTFQTVTNVLLPPLVRRLRQEQPSCDVRLFEDETAEPRLEDLDLVFFDAPPQPGVDGRLIVEDDHVLIAQPGAFPHGPLRCQALDGLAVVALPPICDQGRIEQLLASGGTRPRVVFRTADNQAVVSMVPPGPRRTDEFRGLGKS